MNCPYTYKETHCPKELLTPRLKAVNPICLDVLYQRGLRTAEDMEEFLFPSLEHSLRKYPSLLDLDKALHIFAQVVKNKLPTVVYHDYDVDGITAAAVATECLRNLGVPVSYYCNDRTVGGFGICASGVDELMAKYPDTKVVVTVDNGISGIEGVARAKELGLTIIVTDHHEPDDKLPAADAIIDHKRKDEPTGQDKNCCGAGVIWKVMMGLYIQMGKSVDPVINALDLVALGTVADVVPLLGQNRVFVQEGLKRINAAQRPFFRMVSDVMKMESIDSQTIAYHIAPMINAVSRMEQDASQVVSLLLEKDDEVLRAGIIELDELNQFRRTETEREVDLVMRALLGLPPKPRIDDKTTLNEETDSANEETIRPKDTKLPDEFGKAAIVYRDPSLKEGVIGIVAGQLKEAYHLPTAIFSQDRNGNWKGSCRSPYGFHLKKALDGCSQYLLSYGGHSKAAGVTVRDSDFEAFQSKFEALAMKFSQNGKYPEETAIDMVLPASAYTEQLVRELSILEPFGEGFPKLLFGLVANITGVRYMGTESQHVKYTDQSGLVVLQWNQAEKARSRLRHPSKFVGYPQLNSWNGNISVQFVCT